MSNQGPPINQQEFRGYTKTIQREEIERLASLLGVDVTISPSVTKSVQQNYYERLTRIYSDREAGANSPPQPPSPDYPPNNAPPQQPPELNLNPGPITPDEFEAIPSGRAGTDARRQAWETLLQAIGSSGPRRRTSAAYREMYQELAGMASSGNNNNRNRLPKRSRDPLASEQQNQEQQARRRPAPEGSSKVERDEPFENKRADPPSTRSLVQGNRFSQSSREFVVDRLTGSLADISVTSNPFRTQMAGLLNTQIGSQSAPSTSEANADLARQAFETVRGRVNANLLNLFMGLGRGVEANMGNPPMLRGQLPGNPRPGITTIYSPEAQGRVNEADPVAETVYQESLRAWNEGGKVGDQPENPNANIRILTQDEWNTITAPIREGAAQSPQQEQRLVRDLSMYFHRETADDGTDYYYLTVPIDNLLFNMNSGDYENYADYLTSEAQWVVDATEQRTSFSENLLVLTTNYFASNYPELEREDGRSDSDRISRIRNQLQRTGADRPAWINQRLTYFTRVRLRSRAFMDTYVGGHFSHQAQMEMRTLPLPQIALEELTRVRNIQTAHRQLIELISTPIPPAQVTGLWNRLTSLFGGRDSRETRIFMISAYRERLWILLQEWFSWYQGLTGTRGGNRNLDIGVENFTFGGCGIDLERRRPIDSILDVAVTELPGYLRQYLVDYYRAETITQTAGEVQGTREAFHRAAQNYNGDIAGQERFRHTQNIFEWFNSQEGRQFLQQREGETPQARALRIQGILANVLDLSNGNLLREAIRNDEAARRAIDARARQFDEQAEQVSAACIGESGSSRSSNSVCEAINGPMYARGQQISLPNPQAGQGLSREAIRTARMTPQAARILALPGDLTPANVSTRQGIAATGPEQRLLENQYVVQFQGGYNVFRSLAQINNFTVYRTTDEMANLLPANYTGDRPGELVQPNYEAGIYNTAQTLGQVGIDVSQLVNNQRRRTEKDRKKEIREQNKSIFFAWLRSQETGQNSTTSRAIRQLMTEQRLNEQQQATDERDRARRVRGAQKQSVALEGQHSGTRVDSRLQESLYLAYLSYLQIREALDRTWRAGRDLWTDTGEGQNPYRREGSNLLTPDEWNDPTSYLNLERTSIAGQQMPQQRRGVVSTMFRNAVNGLLSPFFEGETFSLATTPTMGELWNNGRILTFNQYLHRFFSGSGRATYSAITRDAFGNDGTANWASQAESILGSSFAEWNRRRGEARNRARQQAEQEPPQNSNALVPVDDNEDDDLDMSDGEDGDEAPTTTTTTTNTGTDTGGVPESKSGGKRKKKTRKRRKKTRRRKKMKGGKKTKNKRKKKKKSKTRKKRGGRDCKKILEDEEVCDRKSWMKASRKLHPDKGGDAKKFRNMNECYKENKANLSCSEESKIVPSAPEKEEVIPKGDTKMEEKLHEIQKKPLMIADAPKEVIYKPEKTPPFTNEMLEDFKNFILEKKEM